MRYNNLIFLARHLLLLRQEQFAFNRHENKASHPSSGMAGITGDGTDCGLDNARLHPSRHNAQPQPEELRMEREKPENPAHRSLQGLPALTLGRQRTELQFRALH